MNLLVIVTLFAVFSVNAAFSRRWTKRREENCQSGDGSSYRGHEDKSSRGRRCLNWNRFRHHLSWESEGLGNHNYCRNPDESAMPWCYVRRNRKYVRELCNIPKCSIPSKTVDTELTCGERSQRRLHKIVGGSFTPIESHPWISAIFYKKSLFLCGGSLISPCWVLTAAHCLPDGEHTSLRHLSVYLGKSAINDTDDKEQSFTVEEIVMHQKYNDSSYNSDIALLKIKSPSGQCAVKSASVRTVCLPPPHTQLPTGYTCSIAGFGKERYTSWRYSQYLKQAEVNLLSQTECSSGLQYGNRITDNMFCAGSPDWSRDACKGDSGGPLVCEVSGRMFLFGVVSWGEDCAKENKPGVYTRVTNFNTWIAEKTGLPEYTKGLMYPQK
ncbi:unnamed protein product [Ophioblennius macclurei]